MITAIVQFKLPDGTTIDDAKAMFDAGIANYRGRAGLVRKYYLYGEGGTAGGVYLWENRAAADALYTAEWKSMIEDRFGAAPNITFFETPVIVDNTLDGTASAAE